TNYQIHITKDRNEAVEPPPFFESEFKERLERMNFKIKEKEVELKGLEETQNKKKGQLSELEEKYYKNATERNKLELEVNSLKSQKDVLHLEVRKTSEKIEGEESKITELRDFVNRLENEERSLKETIISQNLILTNLKDEREKKSKEVDQQRILLANLHLDTSRIESQIVDLSQEQLHHEQEIQLETSKVEKILHSSESAMRENTRLQTHIAHLLKEKALLDHDVNDLQTEVTNLESVRKTTYNKLQELNLQVNNCESQSIKLQEELQRHQENETNLKNLNGELHTELVKIEEKLSQKKNQLNQVDFQGQDAARKLSTVTFELERASLRLKELSSEEKAQEMKMLAIRDDFQIMGKRANEDKKIFLKNIEDEKYKHGLEVNSLKVEIEDEKKILAQLESQQELLKVEIDELNSRHRNLGRDKQTLEIQVGELKNQKSQADAQIQILKNDTLKFEHDKSRAQRELSQLQIKMMDCETQIMERHQEAHLALENFKREERARIDAEKNVCLSEVEAFKHKSLNEVEKEYRKKQDELHQQKLLAMASAEDIIKDARLAEVAITQEATTRLRQATLEAQEREVQSHNRVKEAQEYFKAQELEAEAIIQRSRLDSREYVKKTETELMADLSKRKLKIKNFLSMKQEAGQAHIKALTDQHMAKMRREDEKAQQKLEEIKRKELKRIARLRDEEMEKQNELKEAMLKSLKMEKEKVLNDIQALKNHQESELGSKKKSVLEHINTIKFSQQESWEKELKRQKDEFNQSKKARIQNATQAVMNVFSSETGSLGVQDDKLKERVLRTLEMAIDGQTAGAMKEVNQILDFNPTKHKQIAPVLRKYAWQVGIPAAMVIILLADIGSARTLLVDGAKQLMKQRHSASEMYVNQQKTEWKEKHTFNPTTTVGYKATYTENILFTTDFEKVMDNEEFQND
ncbi:MAG: hypothetical protein H0V66_13610, partial [Bdellovibrionales bacterium]|nr:hypothetical protein [Bdellovibrionales bacterium]